jgi:hypothetical protein
VTDPIPLRPADEGVERRKRADESKDLLDNKAFTAAILALRKRYFELMMGAQTTEEKLSFIERIRALEDVPQQLQIFVNDQVMAQARKK